MTLYAAMALGTGLIVWPVAFVLAFALLAALAGSSGERRSHFWTRAVLLPIAPAALPLVLSSGQQLGVLPDGTLSALGPYAAVAAALTLMVLPALLYRTSAPSPGDSGDDGGLGPDPPPDAPNTPGGDLPLPDADQSAARLRDHNEARRRWRSPRRVTREPRRTAV